jgi:transposase-like protein
MADSIIYATSLKFNCILWTLDEHFENLKSVNYYDKNNLRAYLKNCVNGYNMVEIPEEKL